MRIGPEPPLTVSAKVTHLDPDHFHVEYALSRRSSMLVFSRSSPVVRKGWVPFDGKIYREHEEDFLAGGPHTRFDLDLTVDEIQPDKDYRNFYTFTDGGRLLYTGHLAVNSVGGGITLIGAPGESVIARGQTHGQTVTLPMQSDGTYVYFGKSKPLETDDFVGVIDPGLPANIRADLDSLTPKLFKRYSDGFGRPSSEKPLLFATYAKRGPGTSIGGGVMKPRVVNLGFEFDEDPVSEPLRELIDFTIAHESAHLWNADLYSSDSAWIKEGTADALAFQALRDFGTITEARYRRQQSDALSLCVIALAEGAPLSTASRPGHHKELYFCGATMALLSEAATKEPLIGFLKEVFAGPNNHYDDERYFSVLSAKNAAVGAFVRTLATAKLADPITELPAAMARAGVALEPGANEHGRYYDQLSSGYAVRAVVAPKCLEFLSFGGDLDVSIRVMAPNLCGEMIEGDRVDALAGVKLRDNGGAAWDAAIAECRTSGTVRMGRKGKPDAHVPCAKTPRARPQYLQVTKAP